MCKACCRGGCVENDRRRPHSQCGALPHEPRVVFLWRRASPVRAHKHVIRFVNTILALNCGQSANHCRRLAALSKSAGNSSASTCPADRERNPVSTNCSASELRTPPGGLVTIEPNQRPGLVSVKSHTASSV